MIRTVTEGPDTRIQITLNYIDKLFTARQGLAEAGHRFSLIGTVLSVVMLAVSAGAASSEQKLTVSGIGLKVPIAVSLTLAALVLGVLTVAAWTSIIHASLIDYEIQRLYKNIEFEDQTLYAELASPFRNENAVTAFISTFSEEDYLHKKYLSNEAENGSASPMYLILQIALVIVMPTAAQVGAGFKVSELLPQAEGLGWVWMLFALLAVSTSAATIYPLWQLQEAQEYGRARGKHVIIACIVIGLVLTLPGIGLGYFVARVVAPLLTSP